MEKLVLIYGDNNCEMELNLPADITSEKKTIYEDENITVSTTGKDYDFIAIVENHGDEDVTIRFDESDEVGSDEHNFSLDAGDWAGLLANVDGYICLSAFYNGKFSVEEGEL
jgi:hypothetical protein